MQKQQTYVDLSDAILKADRRQSIQNPDAVFCPKDRDHGRLGVHGSGSALICTARGCDSYTPLSRD